VMNEAIMKELVSGLDIIQARVPYQPEPVRFYPQFKLVVCANILPKIKAQDHGTWRRIRVVPYMSLFTENPVKDDKNKPYQFKLDPTIDEKFDSWKTVFLAMLIDRVLITDGKVNDCDIVLKASNEYKNKEDVISQFIDEKIVRAPESNIILKKSSLNADFENWHRANYGTKGPQSKELHDYMDRLFGPHEKTGWKGLLFVTDNADEDPNDGEIEDCF